MWTTALLISILRLAVRYWNLKRLFWDDAFAISAMIWLTVMATLNQLSCNAIYLMEALAEGRTPPAPFLTTPDQIITTIISQRKNANVIYDLLLELSLVGQSISVDALPQASLMCSRVYEMVVGCGC
jgi:hypothetical protein